MEMCRNMCNSLELCGKWKRIKLCDCLELCVESCGKYLETCKIVWNSTEMCGTKLFKVFLLFLFHYEQATN